MNSHLLYAIRALICVCSIGSVLRAETFGNERADCFIKVVSNPPIQEAQQSLRGPVFSVHLEYEQAPIVSALPMTDGPGIPAGALWPGASGKIEIVRERVGVQTQRNPWEKKPLGNAARKSDLFVCGGAIVVDGVESCGFLGGHIVKKGDRLGSYIVTCVVDRAVVLEKSGIYIVVPVGEQVSVVDEGP